MSTGNPEQQAAKPAAKSSAPKSLSAAAAHDESAGVQSSQALAARANYYANGRFWDHIPGSDVTAGDVIFLGAVAGVADNDIAANEKGALAVEGNYTVNKDGSTFAAGDVVNYSGGEATSGAGTQIGICAYPAAAGDPYVVVALNKK